jgi:hypothetical protein
MMPMQGLASCHERLKGIDESDDCGQGAGPPNDDDADKAWRVSAGVVPLQVDALAPIPADDLSPSLAGFELTRVRCANM